MSSQESRWSDGTYHIPVMADEVVARLVLGGETAILDCTVGDGGHALRILEHSRCFLVGIDKDEDALTAAAERLSRYKGRFLLTKADFREARMVLARAGIPKVDGVLFDLGVSLRQVMDPSRGFSYRGDALLDMRMDRAQSLTAIDLLATCGEEELARILREFGEERYARRIAHLICSERERQPVTTATQLVKLIYRAIPARARRTGGHPARRTFQALRIAVNRELDGLDRALEGAFYITKPGGRVVVLSYHSLEDAVTKEVFKRMEAAGMALISDKKPLRPSVKEIEKNPRSRSAKLRAAILV